MSRRGALLVASRIGDPKRVRAKHALITGAGGQLGWELQRAATAHWEVRGVERSQLDVTSSADIAREIEHFRPALVINAAAYTAVDRAETDPSTAFAVNEGGPANLAAAAACYGFRLVHISTDFVFDGRRFSPYKPADMPNPLGVYGASKLAGERRIAEANLSGSLIIRTAWLYSTKGHNFVRTILRLLRERDRLRVVADQTGSPTWAGSLANALWRLVDTDGASGVFHWVDNGEATWHQFAVAIQEEALDAGLVAAPIPIDAIGTEEYAAPARRPAYSVLDCSATVARISVAPRPWRENLRAVVRAWND